MFNVEKSKVVVFRAKRARIIDTVQLCLGSEKLEVVHSFVYLGVEFHESLAWDLMKKRVMKKAQARLALVKKAIASGLSPMDSLVLLGVKHLPLKFKPRRTVKD